MELAGINLNRGVLMFCLRHRRCSCQRIIIAGNLLIRQVVGCRESRVRDEAKSGVWYETNSIYFRGSRNCWSIWELVGTFDECVTCKIFRCFVGIATRGIASSWLHWSSLEITRYFTQANCSNRLNRLFVLIIFNLQLFLIVNFY